MAAPGCGEVRAMARLVYGALALRYCTLDARAALQSVKLAYPRVTVAAT